MFVRLNLTPLCQVDRNTGVVVAGAVQTCRPVPGALYPGETENCFPASDGVGAAFGVVTEWNCFSFRCRSLPREGNPKGRGRSPAPLCRFKGAWGKQAKRRQWRMKRACFEEAARLAAPKGPGIAMPRRC